LQSLLSSSLSDPVARDIVSRYFYYYTRFSCTGTVPSYEVKPLSTAEKKENKFFLIYKEIQTGAVAKSYMINCLFLNMTKYLGIPHVLGNPSLYMTLKPIPSEFPSI
jgi:hypothetical protein